jgi:TrmH family RNA methyltransferase
MISKNQIKYIQSLHYKKQRQTEKRFIAEGVKTCLEIIQTFPEMLESVFCTENFLIQHGAWLHQKNIQAVTITETQLKQISTLVTPNEVLGICRQFTHEVSQTNFENDFAFYLDGIRDPGNLGTIIRICSWFGIKELFCSDDTVELYNPKCIQSCMGSFLRVKVFYLPLQNILTNKAPQKIYAADLQGSSVYNIGQANGLIIIGNEANGINSEFKKMATDIITIPSAKGDTESLNAAIATAVIASEFFRKKIS